MWKWLVALSVIAGLWLASLAGIFSVGAFAGKYMPDKVRGEIRAVARAMKLVQGDQRLCAVADTTRCGNTNISNRQEVSCAPFQTSDPRNAVLFTFGQSTGANAGHDRYVASDRVANFNPLDGKCYHAEDPLLIAEGPGGSVWGVLGDHLIDAGLYDRVLVISLGISSTEIARWAPSGDLHARVKFTADALAAQGIAPTHVMWHQGESDVDLRTPEDEYVRDFGAIVSALRSYGVDAPIYPAVVAYCYFFGFDNQPERSKHEKVIRAAQMKLPQLYEGVFLGPDTDTIRGEAYRPDNCHMSAKGIYRHAQMWVKVLQKHSNQK